LRIIIRTRSVRNDDDLHFILVDDSAWAVRLDAATLHTMRVKDLKVWRNALE